MALCHDQQWAHLVKRADNKVIRCNGPLPRLAVSSSKGYHECILIVGPSCLTLHDASSNVNGYQRCENALSTSHLLIDMFILLSLEHEDSFILARGSSFLPAITAKNMQELAAFMVIMCMSLPKGFSLRPWASTEQYFGLLRSQFSSSQLSVRDFLYASTVTSQQKEQAAEIIFQEEKIRAHLTWQGIDHKLWLIGAASMQDLEVQQTLSKDPSIRRVALQK